MITISKKLEKALKKANKELKEKEHFVNSQIRIDDHGFLTLSTNDLGHNFPIGIKNAETDDMAIMVIEAYLSGLRHEKEKSYPKFCDQYK